VFHAGNAVNGKSGSGRRSGEGDQRCAGGKGVGAEVGRRPAGEVTRTRRGHHNLRPGRRDMVASQTRGHTLLDSMLTSRDPSMKVTFARGQVALILQRPEDSARQASQTSRASKPGNLWGTAVILGDLEAASRRAEARVRGAVEPRPKQI